MGVLALPDFRKRRLRGYYYGRAELLLPGRIYRRKQRLVDTRRVGTDLDIQFCRARGRKTGFHYKYNRNCRQTRPALAVLDNSHIRLPLGQIYVRLLGQNGNRRAYARRARRTDKKHYARHALGVYRHRRRGRSLGPGEVAGRCWQSHHYGIPRRADSFHNAFGSAVRRYEPTRNCVGRKSINCRCARKSRRTVGRMAYEYRPAHIGFGELACVDYHHCRNAVCMRK